MGAPRPTRRLPLRPAAPAGPAIPAGPAAAPGPVAAAEAAPARVLVVCGVAFVGGGEVALLRLLPALLADGWAPRVAIVAPEGGELAAAVRACGVAVEVLPVGRARYLWQSLRAALALADRARWADVVHANDVRAALWCQLAALLARRPWVWHVRDLVSGRHRFERVGRWLRPTRMVAISGAVARQLLAFGGWDPARVEVVRHGVDADALRRQGDRAAWRHEMGLGEGDLAVGIVGRLEAWKGQEDFVRAAALVANPAARFFVVGDVTTDRHTARQVGDERTRLERLAAQLGTSARITFIGERRDVPSVMAGLDVLVLASHAEPFGLVLLEAMSQGTAVVATAAGGAAEVVVDGAGVLVPPRSPAALAAALEQLLADPARRRGYGATGREHVRARYTLEGEARALGATWRRAIASPRS